MSNFQVFVLKFKKKKRKFKVEKTGTLKDVKSEVFKITQIPPAQQKLVGLPGVDPSTSSDSLKISGLKLKRTHPVRVMKSFFGDEKRASVDSVLSASRSRVMQLSREWNLGAKGESELRRYEEELTKVCLKLDLLEVDEKEREQRKKIFRIIETFQKEIDELKKK